MIDVVVEQEIARPRAEVAAYASDWRNDPVWIGAVDAVRLRRGEPFGTGSRVARTASFLGRRFEYVNEVTELVPGERLAMRSVAGPFPMRVTYEWVDAGAGTRMRIRASGDASRFYRVAGPLLRRAVRRGIAGDLERLRRVLEAEGLATRGTGDDPAMVRHDQNDEQLREAQEGTGYGDDEGERDDALEHEQPDARPEDD